MILAQAEHVKTASDLIINAGNQFGFLAQLVLILIAVGTVGLSLYVWKVVLPERNARIAQMERHADAAAANATNLALIGKSLDGITQLLQSLPCRNHHPPNSRFAA